MNILMIGDISGEAGVKTATGFIARIRAQIKIDLIIANGENAAGGLGIMPEHFRILRQAGIDMVTTGNHVWDKPEIYSTLLSEERLLRPANYSPLLPGRGCIIIEKPQKICIINLAGREHLSPATCSFHTADELLGRLPNDCRIIILDFHAVSTTEKMALAWHLDGRVTCLAGTHTHIQTADERILPGGTAYISDLGMTGPWNSVLGVAPEPMIHFYMTGQREGFRLAGGPNVLGAILLTVDETTGRATNIERIQQLSH
ncbi:MAG: TIGR00282 family metallophosphoesterase [Negativicutes bacterium]|nr:TIGR00282 family metallophosphoesterase [Negativicutes bacterium]